ncbi:citrate synthase family protein [Candidimonas nitroreducens]|nr:citrate synthase family protein [Candidimonas nitroreducens]
MRNLHPTKESAVALIDSKTAAEMLGISLATLYSYVSRGKLGRSYDERTGNSQFNQTEIIDFIRRRDRGRTPGNVARASLDFGFPVLDSQLCEIKAGRPWFRGIDAVQLSETATLEEVAALLWDVPVADVNRAEFVSRHCADEREFFPRFSLWLLQRMREVTHDQCASRAARFAHANEILHAAIAFAAGVNAAAAENAHDVIANAWRLNSTHATIIRRALVLHADHELNPSSFVARCTASTLANSYAVTLAGCCAASGMKHADFTQSYDLVGRMLSSERHTPQLLQLAGQGIPPGFNHPLYPKGDPRAAAILADLREYVGGPVVALIDKYLHTAHREFGLLPKNDFAMAAAAHALGLSVLACQILFIIARVVGWNAHALEQYESPLLIRPRARYVAG